MPSGGPTVAPASPGDSFLKMMQMKKIGEKWLQKQGAMTFQKLKRNPEAYH